MNSPTARANFRFNKPTGGSVRYTKEPTLATDPEAVPLTSDMTVDTVGTEVTDLYSRTQSMTSSMTSRHNTMAGPGWRSNMRGDYNSSDTAPVSSKDILCWAYQVNRNETNGYTRLLSCNEDLRRFWKTLLRVYCRSGTCTNCPLH